MGFFKKAGDVAKSPVTIPFQYINKMAVFPAKVGRDVIFRQTDKFKQRLSKLEERKINANTLEQQKIARDMVSDFAILCEQWGINNENDLIAIKSGMRNEMIAYALMILYFVGSAIVDFTFVDAVILATLMPSLMLVSYVKYWRLSCLRDRKFTPFLEWSIFPHELFYRIVGGIHGY